MANWIKLTKAQYLSVDTMNAIYHNMAEINVVLSNLGLDSVELEDSIVYGNIPPNEILTKMNAVETNIQSLHNALSCIFDGEDKYFSEFLWLPSTQNRKARVDQWIDWLHYQFDILDSLSKEELRDSLGELIIDVNGEQIHTIERIF